VKLNYLKRPYFVTMGLFLMAVLLPFNSSDSITLRELLEITQLPSSELMRHIQQLIEVGIIKSDVSYNVSYFHY
jgi:cullin 2